MPVTGIRKGWEGLTHVRPGTDAELDYARRLTRETARTIDRTGGTMLHTSRLDPQRVRGERLPPHLAAEAERYLRAEDGRYDLVPVVVENFRRLGLDCLIVIGGDGTLAVSLTAVKCQPQRFKTQKTSAQDKDHRVAKVRSALTLSSNAGLALGQ